MFNIMKKKQPKIDSHKSPTYPNIASWLTLHRYITDSIAVHKSYFHLYDESWFKEIRTVTDSIHLHIFDKSMGNQQDDWFTGIDYALGQPNEQNTITYLKNMYAQPNLMWLLDKVPEDTEPRLRTVLSQHLKNLKHLESTLQKILTDKENQVHQYTVDQALSLTNTPKKNNIIQTDTVLSPIVSNDQTWLSQLLETNQK